MGPAGEEAHSDLCLKRRELSTDGRRRASKFRRGPRDAGGMCDGRQSLQLFFAHTGLRSRVPATVLPTIRAKVGAQAAELRLRPEAMRLPAWLFA